jgi:hypothetical protein
MPTQKETADLAVALNRDCRWLERELLRIARATAVSNPDRLRMIAAEAVEKAKKRRKRTLSR